MSTLIPESAPFTEEQRAWLNGFLSGWTGVQGAEGADPLALGTSVMPQIAEAAQEEDEDFPWHDSALPIVDRMEMADGKPLKRKLMASMAQLDCGTCGYLCQTYAEAIASGEETNLTLCSPGGKETKQMIKKLLKEEAPSGSSSTPKNGSSNTEPASDWSRKKPLTAKLIESRPLNKEGSAKDTRHVAIALNGSEATYEVGDALGVFPTNCPDLVGEIIQHIDADPSVPVTSPMGTGKSLREALTEDCCLKEPTDELLELLIQHADGEVPGAITSALEDGGPEGFDVLDALNLLPNKNLTATEFIECLSPMNPRLYSIASSMKHVGNEVHLTVGKVSYKREDRLRKGVASCMLADRVEEGTELRVFRHANHGGFTVPSDPKTPMIMVGPGTGIAPFVAFLQERAATKAEGKNWLFFGDQHEATDFLYKEELESYVDSGVLSRLDTAFSRDGDQKVYVQDRMQENSQQLWQWLQEGAHFYVCGDASRMANDVDKMLVKICAEHGNMGEADANAYVKKMAADKRYVRDVY